jgi:protein TonB
MNKRRRGWRFLPAIAIGLGVLSLGGLAALGMRSFLSGGAPAPKHAVQEVRLIRPPPPPPKVEEPPPPPEAEKVNIPDPKEPEPTPSNDPPPGDQLGLDADGTAGGDGFGLMGRKGGRDLLASGGSAFTWYAGLLKTEIVEQLQEEKRARSGAYSVVVRVWVRDDGSIEKIRLAQSSGDRERDQAIETALSRIARISQGPPSDMPQPISLRIVSRV